MDSMCLARLPLRCGIPCVVAHCHFHLRGAESDGDAALVESWCRERGIPFLRADFDTAGHAAARGCSIEMAARDLRYAWFGACCREQGYRAVVVAHHAEDNVETLLLNLLRGTGLRGLGGMHPAGRLPVPEYGDIPLLRPLLTFSREQIQDWVRSHQVPYREDRTNASTDYRRNLLRHKVLPVLAEINPSYLRTMGGNMQRAAQAQDVLDAWFSEVQPRVSRREGDTLFIDGRMLLSSARPDYLLYRLLEPYGFRTDSIPAILGVLQGEGTVSGKVFRQDGFEAVTTSAGLRVDAVTQTETDISLLIPGPGTYRAGTRRLVVECFPRPEDYPLKQPEGCLSVDAQALPFPLQVRSPRPGDWLRPLGLRGRKKLSDLFTDLKYSLPDKGKALVLARTDDDSHILALLGRRIDESLRITPATRTILRIRMED